MLPLLSDLLDLDLLERMIEEKYVRRQHRPGLTILNYTEKAMYESVWNDVTRKCRGLIYSVNTGEVVARPFEKFFNYGQPEAGELDMDALVTVTNKIDGSLGILYPAFDGLAIATRGSFYSEQAQHATEVLRKRYPDFRPSTGLTYLFEIVYPENRIVLDYGRWDDLFLLGCVDIRTGYTVGPEDDVRWAGPSAETFEVNTFAEALAMPPRLNAEGVVVHFIRTDKRVKIKQDDYVRLHRIITGMNERAVWERLGNDETADDICRDVPEEFWPWIHNVADGLEQEHRRVRALVSEAYAEIAHEMQNMVREGRRWERRDFATMAVQSPYRAYLFMILDDKDPGPAIWKMLRPAAEKPMFMRSEDVA